MIPVCKQTGHPEVERIWYMNKHGQRQQMNEDRQAARAADTTTVLTDALNAEITFLGSSPTKAAYK